MNKTKKILLALQDHLNLKDFKELASYLEISVTLLYSWVRHDKIAGTGKILAKLQYINLHWLETGEGPMAIIDKDNMHLVPGVASEYAKLEPPTIKPPKIAARIEPGRPELRDSLRQERAEKAAEKVGEVLSDEEILAMQRMTKKVLKSDTIHRSALASNIRAFHQAVLREEEMIEKDERMARMENEIAEIKSLLIEMRGGGQKREAAN